MRLSSLMQVILPLWLLGCSALISVPDKHPSDSATDLPTDLVLEEDGNDAAWDSVQDTPAESPLEVVDVINDDPDLDPPFDDATSADSTIDDGLLDTTHDDLSTDTTSDDPVEDAVVPGTWVSIPPGTFLMGSPTSEPGHATDETQHQVTFTRGFIIQSTEVTQDQFEMVMGYNPSSDPTCGGDCPVEEVNWFQSAAYCNALSVLAGVEVCYTCGGSGASISCNPSTAFTSPYDCPGYRLPTESEWEYAARAGTTEATYAGTCDSSHLHCETPNAVLDSIAWFCGNAGNETHPVATKTPNAWGLYDMLGNVWEWCHDWHLSTYPGDVTDPWGPATSSYKVLRGGSWSGTNWFGCPVGYRSALRGNCYYGWRFGGSGFRCARTLP